MVKFDRNLSLEQLENEYWGEPAYRSGLVLSCHRYRKMPVNQLPAEGLRILIGQKIGLAYLVPVALDLLTENPFISGDYYEGDLLQSVLRIEKDFWDNNQDLSIKLGDIMITVKNVYLSSCQP